MVYQKEDGKISVDYGKLEERVMADHSNEELISQFPICPICSGAIGTDLAPPCTCKNESADEIVKKVDMQILGKPFEEHQREQKRKMVGVVMFLIGWSIVTFILFKVGWL